MLRAPKALVNPGSPGLAGEAGSQGFTGDAGNPGEVGSDGPEGNATGDPLFWASIEVAANIAENKNFIFMTDLSRGRPRHSCCRADFPSAITNRGNGISSMGFFAQTVANGA